MQCTQLSAMQQLTQLLAPVAAAQLLTPGLAALPSSYSQPAVPVLRKLLHLAPATVQLQSLAAAVHGRN